MHLLRHQDHNPFAVQARIVLNYENAVAERVNGIFKTEFYLDRTFRNITQVKHIVKEMVAVYNNQRPHASCDYLTPELAHNHQGILKKRWHTYKQKTRTHAQQQDDEKANNTLGQLMRQIC